MCSLSILSSIFTLVSPLFVQIIIDDVLLNKNLSLLFPILIYLVVFYVLSTIAVFSQNYLSEYIRIKILQDKTLKLLDIFVLTNEYFSGGDLLSRFIDNLRLVSTILCLTIPSFVLNIISLILPLCIMIYINKFLCVIIIIPTLLALLIFYILGDRIEKIEEKLLKTNSQIFSFLKEFFVLKNFIKAYAIQNFFLNKFIIKLDKYKKESMQFSKYSSANISSEYLLTGVPMLILIISGSYLIIRDELTLGSFTAFLTYISLFFGPMMQLGVLWATYKSTLPAVTRIKEIYDLKDETVYDKILTVDEGLVELDKVSFSFDFKILSNFSCTFYPGINYLVGDNGSGKSTILKLICKVYSPDKGFIKIDGQDIRNVSMGDLSKYVGIVFSEPYLFEDTIYNNLVLGISDIENVDVFNACKKVNVHEFIMSLPNQYNTIIKEEGCNFSAGEKQKISLARVLIRNPKIILLDEVTRSIDKKSKAEIKESIHSLKDEKTIIIVDHEFCDVSSDFNIVKL